MDRQETGRKRMEPSEMKQKTDRLRAAAKNAQTAVMIPADVKSVLMDAAELVEELTVASEALNNRFENMICFLYGGFSRIDQGWADVFSQQFDMDAETKQGIDELIEVLNVCQEPTIQH